MIREDARGEKVTGSTAIALEIYEQGLHQLQCYIGDPVAVVDRALAEAPEFVMAHCLKAYLNIAGTEKAGFTQAEAILADARSLPANDRERTHLAAISVFVAGDFDIAVERLEDILIDHPRDVLALQIAHLFDFYRGDARNLRDRIARALRAWSRTDRGYHALLGMHAFGLEECGQYDAAEESAREAVALEPRNGWGWHAVTHVMEMQGRREDGIAWLTQDGQPWARESFFAVHNSWHLALFHLDLDRVDRVLDLYDGPIRGGRSPVVLDMIDASAMLWRLFLRGVDVGKRWHELADAWAPLIEDGFYAFNDVHAVMALVGAERWRDAARVIGTQEKRVLWNGTNQGMTRDVGLPVARALFAFGTCDFGTAVEILRPIRSIAGRFGGSHAQRDLIDLTLIEAAKRDGQRNLVAALAAERLMLKPLSPLSRRYRDWAASRETVSSVVDAA
jgi:tetratricopeptide (TPR) repeat protein